MPSPTKSNFELHQQADTEVHKPPTYLNSGSFVTGIDNNHYRFWCQNQGLNIERKVHHTVRRPSTVTGHLNIRRAEFSEIVECSWGRLSVAQETE